MKERYDVVVIGSGLGGLATAVMLAKEGLSVCVLEKNQQYGGNLQTFVRNKTIFDTGVHYIGGLSKGQNLYRYFKYLGIMDDLELQKLDEDGFDVVGFDDDPIRYYHAQGYDNFARVLTEQFPEEEEGIFAYCEKVKEVCAQFPLYGLKHGSPYYENTDLLTENAKDCIASFTQNKKLQAVLGGTNLLYAGESERTPFYVHALTVNTYIESAYRCVNGGSQISKLIVRQLRAHGGDIFKRQEVVNFEFTDGQIKAAITRDGNRYVADRFVSNVDPKLTIDMLQGQGLRKSYVNRVKQIESTASAFSLYAVLKPDTFPYHNWNYYHSLDSERVWDGQNYTDRSWPESYMVSMSVGKATEKWADSVTIMCYMRYDELEPWEKTFNTVAEKNDRGETYEGFKDRKAKQLLAKVYEQFPELEDAISEVYTSTPLSFRDYIGCDRGGIYGYIKDTNRPLGSYVSPRTRIPNLFLTGQCINMHGILGVTISAALTASELIGKEKLLDQILQASEDDPIHAS